MIKRNNVTGIPILIDYKYKNIGVLDQYGAVFRTKFLCGSFSRNK